jgi:BioD-like phosphotransacetylase family protein
MLPLLIESTASYAGKSLLCLGLGLKFQKDGFKIAYLKPLGRAPVKKGKITTDEDAVFIQDAFNLDEPLEQLCPVIVTLDLIMDAYDGKVSGLDEKVKNAYKKISRGKDITLIGGGGSLHEGTLLGLSSLRLARDFNAKVILVDNAEHEINVDCIIRAKEGLKDNLIGVILNRVPPHKIDFIKKRVIPSFQRKQIDILGIIPLDPLLSSVSVRELQQILSGQFLIGKEYETDLIEKFFVGSMNVDKAIEYFKKSKNKAVIVGGDRPDIILAALETPTSCVVLTGGLYPNDILLAKADEMKIPIILVKDDTYSTVQKVDKVLGRLRVKDEKKVKLGAKLIEKEVNFSLLYKKAGLKKKRKR